MSYPKPINRMSRAEIQHELEARGFAVYDDEPTEDLRETLRLDREEDE